MSYDIDFKVKVEGIDRYISVGYCDANMTWNVREMICKSTGLEWKNCENNGYCKEVIPHIRKGLNELLTKESYYKQFEASNGWGTVDGCINFFKNILQSWEELCKWDKELIDVVIFWIE